MPLLPGLIVECIAVPLNDVLRDELGEGGLEVMGVGRPKGNGVEGALAGSKISSPPGWFAAAVWYEIVMRIHCMSNIVMSSEKSWSLVGAYADRLSVSGLPFISQGKQRTHANKVEDDRLSFERAVDNVHVETGEVEHEDDEAVESQGMGEVNVGGLDALELRDDSEDVTPY